MSEINRIGYKQKLNESLEKEVIAFLNYRDGRQSGGHVGAQVDGASDSHKGKDIIVGVAGMING